MMAPQAEGEHLTIPFDDMAFVARTTQLAREAGDIALAYFRRGERTTAAVEHKEGGSPVTEADRRVDDFLRARLPLLEADAGWLSEETIDDRERLSRRRVFVVDPIDGTRAFMAGDPRWGVCIALVEAGRPVVGVVHMPALEATYVAAVGRGALLNGAPMAVAVRQAIDNALIAGPPLDSQGVGGGWPAFSDRAPHPLAGLSTGSRGGRRPRHRHRLDQRLRLGYSRRRHHH